MLNADRTSPIYSPNKGLELTAYSFRSASLRFQQRLTAGVRLPLRKAWVEGALSTADSASYDGPCTAMGCGLTALRAYAVPHEATCATRSIRGQVSPSLGELLVVRAAWGRPVLHEIA